MVVELLSGMTFSFSIVWFDDVEFSVLISVGWIASAALFHMVLSVSSLGKDSVSLWSGSDDISGVCESTWASAAGNWLLNSFSDWVLLIKLSIHIVGHSEVDIILKLNGRG